MGEIVSNCISTIGRSSPFLTLLRRLFRAEPSAIVKETPAEAAPPAKNTVGAAPSLLMASRDPGPLIARTAARLEGWRQRRAGRRRLMGLDDHLLKDLGISRCDAEREYRKPFWRG